MEKTVSISVIGLGKMGCDWVANLLEGGHAVIGYDSFETSRGKAKNEVAKALKWIGKNRQADKPDFAGTAISKFIVADTEEEFIKQSQSSTIFLEVIFEDLNLKCSMLSNIVPKLPADTILWTNTSSLSVNAMAKASGRADKFVGTHGMNPVYQMPAVEVVNHKDASAGTLKFTLDFLTSLGKVPFVAADVTGFWVNKHLVPFMLDAMRALERGEITVTEGDKGLKNSLGHPQGVFKLSDFIGADTMYRVALAMYFATQDPRYYPPAILTRMFKNSELGVKTGKGFYEWDGFKAVKERDFSDVSFKTTDTVLSI